MKKILLFLLLIPSFAFANDIYKYSGFNLSGDLVGEGSVSIDSKDKNFLDINFLMIEKSSLECSISRHILKS